MHLYELGDKARAKIEAEMGEITPEEKSRLEAAGAYCARGWVWQGVTSWSEDACLAEGDVDFLTDQLGHEPNEGEVWIFEDAFRETIDELAPAAEAEAAGE